MSKIKVAIAGIGNVASALIQGVYYYRNVDDNALVPGVRAVRLGGYHIGDLEFVAAFEVDKRKVGKKLNEAIYAPPNNTPKFFDVPEIDVTVQRGPLSDGLGKYSSELVPVSKEPEVNVADVLRDSGADILVNLLPVGSENATKAYAQAALDAGVAFINGIPVFVASNESWQKKFSEAKIPVAGDDVQSQVGATVVHKTLVKLVADKGIKILNSYQLNIGGNLDFYNMLERGRLSSKEISKTEAVQKMLPYHVPLKIGPSDYVPALSDTKVCYMRIEGQQWGELPMSIELKLKVNDSPNSAGVLVDVIRAVKIALNRQVGGPLISVSAFAFKHPPVHAPYDIALEWFDEFIQGKRER
ncbi:MAG: inositol-3-phosphate synthase [Candidatus Njordarchaeales archaeon]